MHATMSLFEGVILLAITGVFVVAWWGVKRIVKINDDEAKTLNSINDNLTIICARLSKVDMWMEMHSKQDDERHEDLSRVSEDLRKTVEELKLRRAK